MAGAIQVITGVCRASFPHVFQPQSFEDGDAKFGIVLLYPKTDKVTHNKMLKAIEQAYQNSDGKLGKVLPKMPDSIKHPLKDGDIKGQEAGYEAYLGHWYVSANGNRKPGIRNAANTEDITDPDDFYPGVYCRASIGFQAFQMPKNKGIACFLNNLQKIRDGERFDGRKNAAADFDDGFEDDYVYDDQVDQNFKSTKNLDDDGLEDWER